MNYIYQFKYNNNFGSFNPYLVPSFWFDMDFLYMYKSK